MDVSIIIPAYNNKELLDNNLPSLIQTMEKNKGQYEIIVVDDAGTDQTAEYLKNNFSQVRVIRLERNKRFPGAVNYGVKKAKYENIFLLNSDMKVPADFLDHLIPYFENPKVFAVSNKAMESEEKVLTKSHYIEFRHGFFKEVFFKGEERPHYAFGASGGHALFDKNKFLLLGGFDEIFKPGYYEDADLSYRAWKRGWYVYYDPRSVVYHANMGTHARVFSPLYIKIISQRNALIFLWKNLTDMDLMIKHIFFLPWYLISRTIRRPYVWISFFLALGKLKYILKVRKIEKPFIRNADKNILQKLKGDFLSC